MKIVGILFNSIAALIAVAIIWQSTTISGSSGSCTIDFNEMRIIAALLLLIVSLLFSQVYCSGGKK